MYFLIFITLGLNMAVIQIMQKQGQVLPIGYGKTCPGCLLFGRPHHGHLIKRSTDQRSCRKPSLTAPI